MSLMMQMCMAHKQEKDEEMRRNGALERALKMPQSEFERAVTRHTKDGVTDYAQLQRSSKRPKKKSDAGERTCIYGRGGTICQIY